MSMGARLLLLVFGMAVDVLGYTSLDYSWMGPAQGCEGALEVDQLNTYCTLPSGNVTVNVNRAATWMKIICEENSTFACDELTEAQTLISNYLKDNNLELNRLIDRLDVKNCVLPSESLACPLSLISGNDVTLLRLLDISGEVKPEHLKGIKSVEKFRIYYKSDENITSLPFDTLATLPALKSFSMKRGALVLDPRDRPKMAELKMLELAEGKLKYLPKMAFNNMPNLENLLLWRNEIDEVDVDAFEGLARLANLSLNSNRLARLPPGVFGRTSLARLDLYDNRLEELRADLLAGLVRLTEVIIFNNKAILRLENGVFSNLPALYHVKLESSSIRELPEDLFANSTDIRELYLSGNRLQTLPSRIFRDQKLKILYLNNNNLDNLPADLFSKQDALEELNLKRNAIEHLPGGLFSKMRNLKILNLGGNLLETLDGSSFSGLSSLVELNLSRNRIKSLRSAVFEVINSLQILSLARNALTISETENTSCMVAPELLASYENRKGLPDLLDVCERYSAFRSLKELRRLDLGHNNVSLICEDWKQLLHLERLDLSYNGFAAVTRSQTYFTSNITVDLRHNSIAYFEPNEYPPDLYRPQNVPTFLIGDNPYACDCRLFDFARARRSSAPSTALALDGAVCAEPPALRGAALADLPAERLTCEPAGCPAGCACLLRPAAARLELVCAAAPRALPPRPEGYAPSLRLTAPADLRALPPDVRRVDMSALNLTEAPLAAAALEIDLTGNRLTAAPVRLLRLNCTLLLADNPLECGCGAREGVAALRAHASRVLDYGAATCADGAPLAGLSPERLCAARDAAAAGCALALLGALAAALAALLHRYPAEARILLRKLCARWAPRELDDGKEYDAFVSFAHEDERFVAERLVPRLESGPRPLRLCVHYRDWVVGDFIPAQIERSVERSRRTIVVLSEHFLRSAWAQLEFRAAHGRERLVVLMLAEPARAALDPELRAYVAMNTYVRADDPLVWERLRDAVLPRRRGPAPPEAPRGLDVRLDAEGRLVNEGTRKL